MRPPFYIYTWVNFGILIAKIVTDRIWDIRNLGFVFWKCHGEMSLKGKLNKIFCHFFPYLMFIQNETSIECTAKLWKTLQYGKNLAKNGEKSAINSFFGLFWVPVRLLILNITNTMVHNSYVISFYIFLYLLSQIARTV